MEFEFFVWLLIVFRVCQCLWISSNLNCDCVSIWNFDCCRDLNWNFGDDHESVRNFGSGCEWFPDLYAAMNQFKFGLCTEFKFSMCFWNVRIWVVAVNRVQIWLCLRISYNSGISHASVQILAVAVNRVQILVVYESVGILVVLVNQF